jgi:hypothetical protein
MLERHKKLLTLDPVLYGRIEFGPPPGIDNVEKANLRGVRPRVGTRNKNKNQRKTTLEWVKYILQCSGITESSVDGIITSRAGRNDA